MEHNYRRIAASDVLDELVHVLFDGSRRIVDSSGNITAEKVGITDVHYKELLSKVCVSLLDPCSKCRGRDVLDGGDIKHSCWVRCNSKYCKCEIFIV